ncbi:hypothetical protein KC19_2G256000 [Ceratodon purpureus]|uniref:Uncharacterized protein n=1 Tax=Ceratodon purpureus TaxID=3225 RepID=A0A8T0IXZ9_CERPU|nr:hypothetical protein KC19_2G256000 [Ceratodon purpureus]
MCCRWLWSRRRCCLSFSLVRCFRRHVVNLGNSLCWFTARFRFPPLPSFPGAE